MYLEDAYDFSRGTKLEMQESRVFIQTTRR